MVAGLAIGAVLGHGRPIVAAIFGITIVSVAVLARHSRELGRTVSELQRRTLEAESASAAKSHFLANMSHELRTPLNGIMGFAELLHDGRLGPVNAEQGDGLADILTSSRHLLALINDLLDLSRVESGRVQVRPETVDAGALARQCVDSLRPICESGSVDLALEVPEEMGVVRVDPSKLRQVIFNYLSNAIDFTPAGGRVVVRVRHCADRLRLEVSDTGPGIAARDHDRVFFEFEQLHSAVTRRISGTGLGLAVTKRIVEAQGGSVGLVSALGEGSTFFAELPLTDSRPVAPRAEVHRLSEGFTVLAGGAVA